MKGKWESVFSGEHIGNVPKETHVVSVMTHWPLETVTVVRDEKDVCLLPHSIQRKRLAERNKNLFHKNQAIKRKARQIKEARFDPDTSFVNMRRVSFGILPCVRTTSLKKVVDMVTNAISDTVGQKRRPTKRSKKGAAKRSVAILMESIQLGCVSQDSYPRKSILRESGKFGSKHTVKLSKDTWHQIKYPGKQGSHRRAMHMMSENEKKKTHSTTRPQSCRWGSFAKTTDTLMSGPAVKSHD